MGPGGGPPPPPAWLTVVGVVGHVRAQGLEVEAGEQVYTPYAQGPRPLASFAMRTQAEPLRLAAEARRAVWSVDPELPVEKMRTMQEIVEQSFAGLRSYAVLLALFAAVALVLAAVGVYGVIAYSVAQRAQEIGVRVAMGAQRGQVLRLVIRQGLALAALGIGLGLALAFWSSRYLESLLFGVGSADIVTFATVTMLLLGLCLLATYLPARRATLVDPVVALRAE